MRKCTHCGSDGRIQVQANIAAPAELAHNFSKTNLRRKDVYLIGVNWETMDFICGNAKCGKVSDGYGNYVSNLQKNNDALKAEVAKLKAEKEKLQGRVFYLEGKKNDYDNTYPTGGW